MWPLPRPHKIYECISHRACGACLRVRKDSVTHLWCIDFSDQHHSQEPNEVGSAGGSTANRGVPQHLRAQLYPMLEDGESPKRALLRLGKRTLDAAGGLDSLLRATQDAKKRIRRKEKGRLEISSWADVKEWAHPLKIGSDGELPSETEPWLQHIDPEDRLFILRDGICDGCQTFVFSSRLIFDNLAKLMSSDIKCYFVCDGTHKVHYGQWVFITLGTYSIRYSTDSKKLVHTFRPIAFAFAPSESSATFQVLFRAVCETSRVLYGIAPSPAVVVGDRGGGLRAAVASFFPEAKVRANFLPCANCLSSYVN